MSLMTQKNIKKPDCFSDEAWNEFAEFIRTASGLTPEDQERLSAIVELNTLRGNKLEWTSFSIMVLKGLFHAYENGEVDFEKMMRSAWNCTIVLKDFGLGSQFMGVLASCALKTKPKKKNAKMPPYPTWLKETVVALYNLIKNNNPEIKLSPNESGSINITVPKLVLEQLIPFDLHLGEGGNTLSEKTLYGWVLESKKLSN